MKKGLCLLTTILALLYLTGLGQAQSLIPKFSLKLSPGYGMITVGDINKWGESFDSFLTDYAAFSGLIKGGKYEKLNTGYDFEGEIMVNLTKNFGIAVGTGYLLRRSESVLRIVPWSSIPEFQPVFSFIIKPEITAIPVHSGFYFFTPLFPWANFYVNAGVGYYFGKGKIITRDEYSEGGVLVSWGENRGEIKDNGLGLYGGIGFEFNLISKIALFVEGKGRYCKLKNWEGDETYTDSDGNQEKRLGTVWYYEQLDSDLNKWYSSLALQEEAPSGADIRYVRKFEADLSGFSLKVGVRIKF